MSWLVKTLTPVNTEEVRPGLFIQTSSTARGKSYRQITPCCWDGKIDWKITLFGDKPFKYLFIFLALMLLSYGYYQGTHSCAEFQEDPCKYLDNITDYCSDVDYWGIGEVNDGREYTFNISDYNP